MVKKQPSIFQEVSLMVGYLFKALPLVLVLMAVTAVAVLAATGTTDSPGGPSSPAAQMYTLEDIFNRLDSGATGSPATFTEPPVPPGTGTMYDLNDIMGIAPAVNASGAITTDVLVGKPFWGLTSGGWGTQTGERHGGCHCANGTLNGTRWCDNGDGTVTDLLGYQGEGKCLVWMKNAGSIGQWPLRYYVTDFMTQCLWHTDICYDDAHTRAAEAYNSVSDGSNYADWRVPTLSEMRGITLGTEPVSFSNMRAFAGIQAAEYWSSTSYSARDNMAYYVSFSGGGWSYELKTEPYYVWPVRGP